MTRIFKNEIDHDGIMTVIIDAPGKAVNVIDDNFVEQFDEVVKVITKNADVKGVLVTSGKATFLAGADLVSVERAARVARENSAAPLPDFHRMNLLQRKLETCGKPVVAAINGTALGGGFELCLACHYRLIADDQNIRVGLPEVNLGLLPGGGGTQRLPRMLGVEKALALLLQGTALAPREALAAGLVDVVAPQADLLETARTWLRSKREAKQPWDKRGFEIPGAGIVPQNPKLNAIYLAYVGQLQRQGNRNYPAPQAILSCVYEGIALPLDRALEVEGGYFRSLFASPVAANTIRTNFINKGKLDKLVHRPRSFAQTRVSRLGVLGAGMMGAGIAYVSALAGIEVVLLDRSLEIAEKGKAYSQRLLNETVKRGKLIERTASEILDRIHTTTAIDDLSACDFIIETVFEDRTVKADVTARAAAVVQANIIFGSNTSTLPITGLAQAYSHKDKFIGIHFFSPVDRMALVEIIRGKETSDEALAKTMDYVRQIGKTPILVNDHRGFFTSRVFSTYLNEGMKMVLEGVSPALIENAGRLAGMPVGPLVLQDEVSFELSYLARNQTRADLGKDFRPPIAEPIIDLFYEKLHRLGKKNGKGFYDYFPDGSKELWPGLKEYYPLSAQQPNVEELKRRFLYIQSIETARCLDEGVLRSPIDGDVGAVLGWSFAPHTGGPLSLIDSCGTTEFVADCHRMVQQYGERFSPPALLVRMAKTGEKFYDQ